MLVYIFSHERPGERSREVIPLRCGCYFKESMQRWKEQLSGKRAERAKTQIYLFDQSILANVKQMFPCSKKDCRTIHYCAKVYIFQGKWKITPEIYWNLCKKYENVVCEASICIYILYQF